MDRAVDLTIDGSFVVTSYSSSSLFLCTFCARLGFAGTSRITTGVNGLAGQNFTQCFLGLLVRNMRLMPDDVGVHVTNHRPHNWLRHALGERVTNEAVPERIQMAW